MKIIALLSVVLSACIVFAATEKPVVSMKIHQEAGFTCLDCHGNAEPTKKPAKSYCIGCHDDGSGSYYGKVVPNVSGAGTRQINPHNSHQGDIRCTLCHTYHKEPVLMCNECHNYGLKVK